MFFSCLLLFGFDLVSLEFWGETISFWVTWVNLGIILTVWKNSLMFGWEFFTCFPLFLSSSLEKS